MDAVNGKRRHNSATPMMTTKMKINIGVDLICLQKLLFVYSIQSEYVYDPCCNVYVTRVSENAGHLLAFLHTLSYIYIEVYSYIFLGGQIILKVVFAFAIAVVVWCGVVWWWPSSSSLASKTTTTTTSTVPILAYDTWHVFAFIS